MSGNKYAHHAHAQNIISDILVDFGKRTTQLFTINNAML